MSELRPVVITGRQSNRLQWRVLLAESRVREGEEWITVPTYGEEVAEIERPPETFDHVRSYVEHWLPYPQQPQAPAAGQEG